MKRMIPGLRVYPAVDALRMRTSKIRHLQKQRVFPEDVGYDRVCNRAFTKQHLAIWLSHVQVWERLLTMKNPKPYHIIFEDDAILQPRFLEMLSKYEKRFERMDFAQLYVFPYQVKDFKIKRRGIYRTRRPVWGTQCYMIPHHRLEWLIERIKPMQTAIDEQLTRIPMKSYFIYDDFVKHGDIASENMYA